ncbi:hypothetical protein ABE61_19865 [Lysinibacillus sphaericus]|uniref:hypothetical protein n=1 Tax=Lysinibacillus sphaericus TaxID=1421 RepID=UPI0018CE6354|nr:hypothetical protein [Lysinibacillus sphaericus]MBG9456233.1 hypothetical protein [Lysinibacillus sphaericus]MBG9479229.1 hypothetical protein [Lysinibacillus sphaericus]MBG9591473.1 hypothetical protein [Lysinibacillus sphaericus]
MKKRYKLVIGILLPLLILYASTIFLTRDSTFDKEVIERFDIEQINEIELIRSSDNKTITITDVATINQIMQQFENQSLRKVYFSTSDYDEAYWLTLRNSDNLEIGIRLDNSKHLFVYLYEENYMKDYKLLDHFNMTFFEDLF